MRALLPVALLLFSLPAAAERLGDAFTFRLKLGPIETGRARLAITPQAGDRQIHVRGEAEAVGLARTLTGLHADYRVVLDADTLVTRRVEVAETGLRERKVRTVQTGRRVDVVIERPGRDPRLLTGTLPGEARDPVAALLMMRAAPLRQGDRMELYVLDGAAIYKGSVQVQGRGEVETPLGPRRAVRILCRGHRVDVNGVPLAQKAQRQPGGQPGAQNERQVVLWLSDDAQRVPLRMEGETDLGRVLVELTSYEGPQSLPSQPSRPSLSDQGTKKQLSKVY